MHDEIGKPDFGFSVGVDRESLVKQGFEFFQILFLDANSLGETNQRAGLEAMTELHGALEMAPGARFGIGRIIRAAHFKRDQKRMDGPVVERFIESERAVDKGFDERKVGDQVRIIFGKRNGRRPGDGGPVEQRDIFGTGGL